MESSLRILESKNPFSESKNPRIQNRHGFSASDHPLVGGQSRNRLNNQKRCRIQNLIQPCPQPSPVSPPLPARPQRQRINQRVERGRMSQKFNFMIQSRNWNSQHVSTESTLTRSTLDTRITQTKAFLPKRITRKLSLVPREIGTKSGNST